MDGPWRFGATAQYQMALHRSADWRLKGVDIDLFGYGSLGRPVFYEYKGHLAEYPWDDDSEGTKRYKQDAQMSILKDVADGLKPAPLFHVGVSLESRHFVFWPKNQKAQLMMAAGHCPVVAGTELPDRYFEAFMYMSRGMEWTVHPEYEAVLTKSMLACGLLSDTEDVLNVV